MGDAALALAVALPLVLAGPSWGYLLASAIIAALALLFRAATRRHRIVEPLLGAINAVDAVAADRAPAALVGAEQRGELGALVRALDRHLPRIAKRLARLQRERGELHAVLSSMEEGVVAIDHRERVIQLNDAAARVLSTPAGAGTGQRLWEVSRVGALREALEATLREGTTRQLELSIAGADARRVVHVHVVPLLGSAAGEVRGAVAVLHDISDLRRLETIRRDFVANVSHELKTPLTAIRGMVETLLEVGQDPRAALPPERQLRFLGRIAEQTGRLEGMVADLMALARLEDQRTGADRQVLDLCAVAVKAAAALEPAAQRRSIALRVDVPDDEVPVLGDAGALRRLVDNLLDNALKYTDDGGRVRLRLRSERGSAVLDVQDSGIGIPPEHRERVFERFYRVDAARTRERGGSGLGLAIVKHVALRHGGAVAVDSQPGEGSTFTVRLPVAAATGG
jgi:two-component system phosphate regulon sensor histidine kinase PhoR